MYDINNKISISEKPFTLVAEKRKCNKPVKEIGNLYSKELCASACEKLGHTFFLYGRIGIYIFYWNLESLQKIIALDSHNAFYLIYKYFTSKQAMLEFG